MIPGLNDGTSLSYDTSGSPPTSVNLSGTLDPYFNTLLIPVNPKVGDPDFDDIEMGGKTYIVSNTVIEEVTPPANGGGGPGTLVDAGTIQAVPEPTSLALAVTGGLGLLGYARRRRVATA